MIVSVCYLLLFLFVGLLLARRAVPDADSAVLLPLGCGLGVSLLAVLPALFALPFGFTLPAAGLAGAAAAVLGGVLLRCGTRLHGTAKDPDRGASWACLLPVAAVTLFLLHTHVLHTVNGTLHTGQSCYGDMPMHLGFIRYIAQSGEFPPRYPLLGGAHRFGYPFLCETVSSVFLLLGTDLRTAYLLPMLPAFLSVYGMFWQLARRVTGSAAKASLAFYLFFMGSGFGFVYFLGSAADFAGIFTGFYTTPTNFVEKNIVWVNPIADLLIPQRATLFGWCVLLPALYLLWRFCYEGERRLWLWLALLVLPLPLLHTHSALALVLLCLVLAQSLDGQQMLRLHFNWINGRNDGTLKDSYLWFYIKNIGLVYLLLIPAFVHAKPKQRWLYGGGLAILALAELVVFQPNNYDNNKLLYVWHMLGCVLAAQLLADLFAKVRALPWRALGLAACCFAAMFGSVLTLGREALSDYQQWSADDIALAAYIDENAESDALFLTSDSHLTPVFALAGRQILCGSGSYVYYHGMDYADEYNAMRTLYETPDTVTLQIWGVQYAVFDSSVYSRFADANEEWYAQRYPLWYENGGCRVYKIF